jgi:predicted nucleic acid-binding protein
MTTGVALADTNVLVYAFDPWEPVKRRLAVELLDDGAREGSIVLPHQALIEFVSATTRLRKLAGTAERRSLLTPREAWRAVEAFLLLFPILYPTAEVVRTAVRGAAAYGLSWFDAHLWAYAETYGVPELLSEDFQDGGLYGTVRIVDPFLAAAETVNEPPTSSG